MGMVAAPFGDKGLWQQQESLSFPLLTPRQLLSAPKRAPGIAADIGTAGRTLTWNQTR
jgi:hypothetical protein